MFLEPCDDMSHSLALGRPLSSDRTCLFSGQGLCLFVVLKNNTKTYKKTKKKKQEGFDSRAHTLILMLTPLGVLIHLPSVEVSYGKTDSALASSSG